ncbi:RIP metalloprotease RseP [Alcaligenes sp. SDU_A2]|uniref:RIP metalloprotease RseP n=1 Tax=Alcaligenes sp. SDU_A2 TaxID=3136634 RepID=UPI00311FF3B3
MLYTLLAFLVTLGVLVTFHELGHYWVARRCGVRVERFSVGFGKVLYRRTDKHGTEWAVSALPLGGYVAMQNDPPPDATPHQIQESFNNKPLWQRAAIVLAGPMANLILAVVIYAVVGLLGAQEPAAVIAQPAAGTPAAQAGFQEADRLTAIDGQPVRSWGEARWEFMEALSSGGELTVTVQDAQDRQRERRLLLPAGEISPDERDLLAEAGLALMPPRALVQEVFRDSAGEQAGLQEGDVILKLGDLDSPGVVQFVERVQQSAGQTLALDVLRSGQLQHLFITPRAQAVNGVQQGRIGVQLGPDFDMVHVRYGPVDSVQRGFVRTAETFWFSLKMIGRMVTGEVSVRNVSGPVTIADYAGQTARIGLIAYLNFLALISISIGLLNLLPVPMLDGGHLLYYAIEAVRGKPASERMMMIGQRIGISLLAVLMSIAFFNDITRLFS